MLNRLRPSKSTPEIRSLALIKGKSVTLDQTLEPYESQPLGFMPVGSLLFDPQKMLIKLPRKLVLRSSISILTEAQIDKTKILQQPPSTKVAFPQASSRPFIRNVALVWVKESTLAKILGLI